MSLEYANCILLVNFKNNIQHPNKSHNNHSPVFSFNKDVIFTFQNLNNWSMDKSNSSNHKKLLTFDFHNLKYSAHHGMNRLQIQNWGFFNLMTLGLYFPHSIEYYVMIADHYLWQIKVLLQTTNNTTVLTVALVGIKDIT